MGSRAARRRRAAETVASGLALVGAGIVAVLAWQAGWWATLSGAALAILWIVARDGREALYRDRPARTTIADATDTPALPLSPLLDQVPVPLVRTDADGAHAINRAARTLFDTDDRILPPIPELLDPAGDRFRHEGRSWRIAAVRTGRSQGLAVLIDVDAEEHAAEGRANDEMIDILGHELLNGLSPILSLADSAVTASAQGDAMLPGILATLARRVEGLENFTRSYRTLSRLPDPVPVPVMLADLAEDLSRLFAGRFGTGVALYLDVAAGSRADVDRDQLTQAIWALLQNGAEAALAGSAPPRVDLNMATADGGLTIRITDSGAGIAPPDRTRIFRPFFTTKPEGSGIGLSLARRIARAHRGDLRLLASAATGFELYLPGEKAGRTA